MLYWRSPFNCYIDVSKPGLRVIGGVPHGELGSSACNSNAAPGHRPFHPQDCRSSHGLHESSSAVSSIEPFWLYTINQ